MSSRFQRPLHDAVMALLELLDASFLAECCCYFGGGTRIVLELGEYRESRDIDFLCADRDGYRKLREAVSEQSLGQVARKDLQLAREVRSDQYGIRTRVGTNESSLKFEIVREARIALAVTTVDALPVPCLGRTSCFAEKFLANADRGLDRSTLSRDLVDLAFMMGSWPAEEAAAGYAVATEAYGSDVPRKLASALELFQERAYRARCVEGLAITDTTRLSRGLKRLASFRDTVTATPPAPSRPRA